MSVPPIVYLAREVIAIAFHLRHDSFFHHPQRTLAALSVSVVLPGTALVVSEEYVATNRSATAFTSPHN
jgi:hypothetical protein